MDVPPLPSSQSERLRRGIELFNQGEFFECHEVLEAAWLEASGEQKQFLQGLIQIAVAFYHLRRGNPVGSARLMHAGLQKLLSGSSPLPQVDGASLLAELDALPQRIAQGEIAATWPAPQIRLLS